MKLRTETGLCIFCAFKNQSWLDLPFSGVAKRSLHATARLGRESRGHAPLRRKTITSEDGESLLYRKYPALQKGSPGHQRVLARKANIHRLDTVSRSVALQKGEYNLDLARVRKTTPLKHVKTNIVEALGKLGKEIENSPLIAGFGLSKRQLINEWSSFSSNVIRTFSHDLSQQDQDDVVSTTFGTLIKAYRDNDARGFQARLKYAFYGHLTGRQFTRPDIERQRALADLRYPSEWFPGTRAMQRIIHLHVGPTNSGKTYHALKRLEQAERGIYAGPLRLLAHEVYTRLNNKGKRCMLLTGDERRAPDDDARPTMQSCTVEMIPLNNEVDVAVIDEIQMVGSKDRGWAWTQALLGVRAKEVHLCGEERVVPLIRELAASLGERLEVHKYERLSPLQMDSSSLDGNLKKLRKGDCIVSFSVMGIHALRREIEKITKRKVAIVYGNLPPETRAQQARLFNDPDNDYDFLVASDAIGMGLNLSIKRIIFETTQKTLGNRIHKLNVAEIKQIAGRAGRYRTAAQDMKAPATDPEPETKVKKFHSDEQPYIKDETGGDVVAALPAAKNIGLVTTLEKFDFPIVEAAMSGEPEPLISAGLQPPAAIMERFASYFPPGTPFSYLYIRLYELCRMHPRFHLCELKDTLEIADAIHVVPGLSTNDRMIFCTAPVRIRDPALAELITQLARCVANQEGGGLLDVPGFPLEVLDKPIKPNREFLRELERLHQALVLYLWLSYSFGGVFHTRRLAFHAKALTEEAIEKTLAQFSFDYNVRQQMRAARERSMLEALQKEMLSGNDQEGDLYGEAALTDVRQYDAGSGHVRGPRDVNEDSGLYKHSLGGETDDILGDYPDGAASGSSPSLEHLALPSDYPPAAGTEDDISDESLALGLDLQGPVNEYLHAESGIFETEGNSSDVVPRDKPLPADLQWGKDPHDQNNAEIRGTTAQQAGEDEAIRKSTVLTSSSLASQADNPLPPKHVPSSKAPEEPPRRLDTVHIGGRGIHEEVNRTI